MRSKNWRPKAIHKKFHDKLFELGCIITRQWPQLHHVVGASYRESGEWIGQWYLIPLSPALHMDGSVNVTSNKTEFYKKVGSEKKLFWLVMQKYVETYNDCPLSAEVIAAIYHCREGYLLMSDQEESETHEAYEEFLDELEIHGFRGLADEAAEKTYPSSRRGGNENR